MSESKLRDLSTDFAVKAIKLTETIHGHRSIVNQLERSATSIGANIREANYAHGKADFIAKLQIALKECYETEYWIEIGQKAEIFTADVAKGILHDCKYGLKVLGNGSVSKKVTVKAAAFSESAKEKIEKAGGKAEVV